MSAPHYQVQKTHCPQGHLYDEENTYSRPGRNERACRACNAEKSRRRRGLAGAGPAEHGAAKYRDENCRCEVCREGHRTAHREALAARYALVAEHGLPKHIKHGVTAYRNWGCRCDVCLDAASEQTIRRRWLKAVAQGKACAFDGCTHAPKSQGLCKQHAHQHQKGEPLKPVGRGESRPSVGSINERGYVVVRDQTAPNARRRGVITEHRKIMAEMLGRPLAPGENVHHKNGVKHDNRPENLELWVVSQPPVASVLLTSSHGRARSSTATPT